MEDLDILLIGFAYFVLACAMAAQMSYNNNNNNEWIYLILAGAIFVAVVYATGVVI